MSSQEDNGSVYSGVSEMDEKAKKKMQNSARWKRWWSKNREAYNEKRRLSAQQKSAKTRAERHKRPSRDEEEDDEDVDNESGSVPHSHTRKRSRRSLGRSAESDEVISAGSLEHIQAGTPPTVSPKLGMHDVISPNLLTLSRAMPMAPLMMNNQGASMLPGLGQFKTLSPYFGIPHQAPRPVPFMFANTLQQTMHTSPQAPLLPNMFYHNVGQMIPGLPYGSFVHRS